MQFGYVPPRHAIAENLLINPRGKINQANEPDGVISAGDYFCDGWKAGPAGCEVYIEQDGFRLVSGSMLQLIPNTLESDRLIRTNLDVISGSPVIKVNGVADKNAAGVGEYIEIEISGLNSKFSRIIAADSKTKPIYQQSNDELAPCLPFFEIINGVGDTRNTVGTQNSLPFNFQIQFKSKKIGEYAVSAIGGATSFSSLSFFYQFKKEYGCIFGVTSGATGWSGQSFLYVDYFLVDARP